MRMIENNTLHTVNLLLDRHMYSLKNLNYWEKKRLFNEYTQILIPFLDIKEQDLDMFREWLEENIHYPFFRNLSFVYFESEEDAAYFKLQWS